MKQSQLENILRKVVKESVREEIKSILKEAILIATSPEIIRKDNLTVKESTKKDLHNPVENDKYTSSFNKNLSSILEQTRQNMLVEDFRERAQENLNIPATRPIETLKRDDGKVVDMSQLDFIKRAKAVFDAATLKDSQRFK